jgi:mannitol-1-phosphate/altronate dehydrogenase
VEVVVVKVEEELHVYEDVDVVVESFRKWVRHVSPKGDL